VAAGRATGAAFPEALALVGWTGAGTFSTSTDRDAIAAAVDPDRPRSGAEIGAEWLCCEPARRFN
jgi:hypothetical protein